MTIRETVAFAVASSIVFTGAFSALAHKGATGIVKQRMEAMSDMKEAMAVIGNMLNGKTDFSEQEAAAAAGQLIRHGARIREQFPDTEESRQAASEATDMVWSDKAKFDSLSEDFVEAANALEAAITLGKPEAIGTAFQQVGRQCSACHEDFRQKKS